jgi:hypothetical protein
MDAIRIIHPDWVEIVTWNAFIEGPFVSPIDDPAHYKNANDLNASAASPSTLHYFHNHRGATVLLAFFIQLVQGGQTTAYSQRQPSDAYRTQLAAWDSDLASRSRSTARSSMLFISPRT